MTALDKPLESPDQTLGSRIAVAIDRFLFTPTRPEPLAICRVLFFTGMFLIFFREDFSSWAGIADELYRPIYLFRRFRIEVASAQTLEVMQIVWLASLIASAIGLLTPVSMTVASLLSAYLLGLSSSFGKIGHGDASLVLVSMFLAFSRCGDAWSVDALVLRLIRRGPLKQATPMDSGEYKWPIQCARVMLAVVFCASGCTKLMYSGVQWVLSDHLNNLIMLHRYGLKDVPWPALATWIAERPVLCHWLAGGALLLEIVFPVALFSRRLRYPILIAAALMQVGIALVMGVFFVQFALLYMFWIPWERVRGRRT